MDHVFARIKSFIGTFRVQHPSEQYYTYTMIAERVSHRDISVPILLSSPLSFSQAATCLTWHGRR